MCVHTIGNQKPLEDLQPGEIGLVAHPSDKFSLAIGAKLRDGKNYIIVVTAEPYKYGSRDVRGMILNRDDAFSWPAVLQLREARIVADIRTLSYDSATPDFGIVCRASGDAVLVFRGQEVGSGQGWLDVGSGEAVKKDQTSSHWQYRAWEVVIPSPDDTGAVVRVFLFQ